MFCEVSRFFDDPTGQLSQNKGKRETNRQFQRRAEVFREVIGPPAARCSAPPFPTSYRSVVCVLNNSVSLIFRAVRLNSFQCDPSNSLPRDGADLRLQTSVVLVSPSPSVLKLILLTCEFGLVLVEVRALCGYVTVCSGCCISTSVSHERS